MGLLESFSIHFDMFSLKLEAQFLKSSFFELPLSIVRMEYIHKHEFLGTYKGDEVHPP